MGLRHFFAATTPRRRHAVVVGGSLAGMLAARVLADHFEVVTLLERDRFPDAPAARQGLPQGRHVHALLERGRAALERLFPGLTAGLTRAGATPLDATGDIAWLGPNGWFVRFPGDFVMLSSTRDLIDWAVRDRVAALPNVFIRHGVAVTGLIPGPDNGVAGVRLRSSPTDSEVDYGGNDVPADLVVVADGRNSRLPDWLAALGYERPQETVVNSFQGYASRFYRPPAGFVADWKALYVQQAPPDHPCGGLVAPVEGGRWLVSLIGGDGNYPPGDGSGFLAFARNLRSPALFDAIAAAEPLSPIASQRATENRLRHYDRLARFPDGLVVTGDAACAFNPVYGQGMTAAVFGAEELDRWLQARVAGPGASRAFQRRLARATVGAWQLSSGADYRFRTTEGPPCGRIASLTGRYVAEVMRVATTQPAMRRRLTEVLHLLRSPAALFSPAVLAGLVRDRVFGRHRATGRYDVPAGATGDVAFQGPHWTSAAADMEAAEGSWS